VGGWVALRLDKVFTFKKYIERPRLMACNNKEGALINKAALKLTPQCHRQHRTEGTHKLTPPPPRPCMLASSGAPASTASASLFEKRKCSLEGVAASRSTPQQSSVEVQLCARATVCWLHPILDAAAPVLCLVLLCVGQHAFGYQHCSRCLAFREADGACIL
jgi:hypothetical protein